MKRRLFIALFAAAVCSASAQVKWINNVKLSGYGIVQYQASTEKGKEANSFGLRLGRISLDGRILDDFYWKAQIQFNGNTENQGTAAKVVDLFAEWQKYDAFKVKIGQFKNPFTFENPMHPVDQGFTGYAMNVSKLAGFSDRAGGHSSNGRDIGLQIQGDFAKNSEGRNLLHYQVGVFNGQGINTKDVDQQKNIIGGVWVMPVEGMRIGAFGWTGSYARSGYWSDGENANPQIDPLSGNANSAKVRKLPQNRYAFSFEYLVNDWTIRSEYVHSTGKAFSSAANSLNNTNCNLSTAGDKAQGVYALVIAPIIPKKFHAKARYDMYQNDATTATQKTQYEIGLDYEFTKNFELSGIYGYVHDRNKAKDRDYSLFDMQVSFRF